MSEAKLMPGKKYCTNCEPPALYCTVEMYFHFEYERTVIKQISGIGSFSEKGGGERCIKSEKNSGLESKGVKCGTVRMYPVLTCRPTTCCSFTGPSEDFVVCMLFCIPLKTVNVLNDTGVRNLSG